MLSLHQEKSFFNNFYIFTDDKKDHLSGIHFIQIHSLKAYEPSFYHFLNEIHFPEQEENPGYRNIF